MSTVVQTAQQRTAAAASPARSRRWLPAAGLALFAVVVAVVPLYASPFTNLQLALLATLAVAILGLDVLIGWAGQVSLGQSAFYGLGAYVTVIMAESGLPLVAALLASGLACAAVGAVVAVPALRLRGYALGMVTLALPVVAVPLAKRLQDVTGGSQGRTTNTATAPAWTGLADDQWRYYVVVVVAATTFLLVRAMLRGRYGRAFATIRANEVVASAMGIAVQRYKLLAFTVAALCGGVAGFLHVVAVQFISPETLILQFSIFMLASLVVGGLRSSLGCLLGAAFYVLVPNLTAVNPERSYLYYGLTLLAVLFFAPGGVAGVLQSGARRLLGPGPAAPPPEPVPAP